MSDRWIEIADGFWNVRGSFKIAGLFDVGTQTSLVRLRAGGFVLLDAYALDADARRKVLALTDQGQAVRAILNLHPFHTAHVTAVAEQFPTAQLYGTARHKARTPKLRWESLDTDDAALHERFADDFVFSVPRGVDFVPKNPALHFSSVLALHKASGTLHVDDTLSWSGLPLVGGLKFHPTLRFTLQKRAGAASEFRAWAHELIALCEGVKQLCTAHTRALPPKGGVADRVRKALAEVSGMLGAHEQRYG
ncbi:MAG TPA: hypothetical protein VFG30_03815 [Polyangiales bacterium]|nr:hypothetical protein [Polyangiales bacterium]